VIKFGAELKPLLLKLKAKNVWISDNLVEEILIFSNGK
jgi:predicted nucleic acid-binding protein